VDGPPEMALNCEALISKAKATAREPIRTPVHLWRGVSANPSTLLCPHRLRALIAHTTNNDYRLLLFCLHQASHNHHASTLYPMPLPVKDQPELLQLRKDLICACCSTDTHHTTSSSPKQAYFAPINGHHILLPTHQALAHQEDAPSAQLISS